MRLGKYVGSQDDIGIKHDKKVFIFIFSNSNEKSVTCFVQVAHTIILTGRILKHFDERTSLFPSSPGILNSLAPCIKPSCRLTIDIRIFCHP